MVDDAGAPGDDGDARIARHRLLHAGADQRRLGADQRHRLALHVRAHERAVGVVILEERDERGGHRHELLRRDVDEIDVLRPRHDEVAALAAVGEIGLDAALVVDLDIGLGDGVAALFHGREVDHVVRHLAVDDAPVRAFDEAVLIDARIGREAVDEADIRAFRRLDRTDAAVMRRVHVAHLEAGALARQAARPERREPPLVRDLRQRVGLVHELRQLRRAEELAHRCRRRLGVDEVVRHHGVDLDRAHALADRPLHAQEADAVLVLHELADRAHAAVAEVVDVVDLAAPVLELDEDLEDGEDVLLAQRAHGILGLQAEPRVHLDAADRRQVVALAVEEQALEKRLRRLERRRLARAHHAIDVDERILAGGVLVDEQRVADVGADRDVIDRQHWQLGDLARLDLVQQRLGDLVAGLGVDLAGLLVDDVDGEVAAEQLVARNQDLLESVLG